MGKEESRELGSPGDLLGRKLGPGSKGGLTHSTEVGKAVLALLGVDQVVAALPGGRPLQHCFRQRAAVGREPRRRLPQPPWGRLLARALPRSCLRGGSGGVGTTRC